MLAPSCLGWTHLLALLAAAVVLYGFRPLQRWRYRHIPGPQPTWGIGNLRTIIKMGFPQAMQMWAAEYGPVFKVWQGGRVLIAVEDPVAARRINVRNHSRPPMPILQPFTGKERQRDLAGILQADGGPYWQSLRQAWQAMMHPSSLREYVGLMNASAERLADVLADKAASGQVVEMWRLFGCLTMEVVGSTAFGLELHTLGKDSLVLSPDAADHIDMDALAASSADDPAAVGEVIQKCTAVFFALAAVQSSPYAIVSVLIPELFPISRIFATYLPDKPMAKLLQARNLIHNVCDRLIDDTERGMEQEAAAQPANVEAGGGSQSTRKKTGPLPPGGFLTHLLQSENPIIGRKFSHMEVEMQAFTFLLAGYETTASALAFTVYHVAANLDKEAKLLAEIDAFGRSRVPTFEDLSQLPYLDAVFNEALRLTPPAAVGTMRVARDSSDVCGLHIPKGTSLITSQFSFQNNSKYWEDVQTFRPERFLEDDAGSNPAFAPFGDGGRSCVGLRFARTEALIALVRLYQRFTLRLQPGQIPLRTDTKVTMSPGKGVYMNVHPRTG